MIDILIRNEIPGDHLSLHKEYHDNHYGFPIDNDDELFERLMFETERTNMRRKDRQIEYINDIESIILDSDVCRIAFADNNTPYIVTMNFGYSGGDHPCLYFHCANEGRKLEMINKNNYVCFEMDTDHKIYEGEKGCDWGMNYSSVVGFGKISVLKDRGSRIEGLNCIMAHYSDRKGFSYDEKNLEITTILKLDIEEMTGKRK